DLTAAIDDAANIDRNFVDDKFDTICTHFITGFVPIDHLAPRIRNKLRPGGFWSFVGGTSHAFPELQRKANSPVLRLLFGNKQLDSEELLTPTGCDAVARTFERHSFHTCQIQMFEPELVFNNFDAFMDFAYHGGWLTPFIEELGLHKAGRPLRALLNKIV